ncbi:MAG: hypothetical protein RMK18_12740, partial [Armatimonadota bacterium]|nr:hypothetical protein [Armatimonadota bacterium]
QCFWLSAMGNTILKLRNVTQLKHGQTLSFLHLPFLSVFIGWAIVRPYKAKPSAQFLFLKMLFAQKLLVHINP